MTAETFLALCYSCKLTRLDLENMTIGMCLDYINEYTSMKNPDGKQDDSRKANQSDFDAF
ncbi:hypothetical protein ABDI49_04655 [Bacillus cereus]|nr:MULTISPECIES: hypothetical protein [Bacillus cereus group]MDO6631763.1 hypothetical protein [Bacillus thuringiensis]MDO6661406.1 hypothetical protein [Bacillus thuringiensis]MDO6701903.1 hypothetical protein [Bacillus thuringiensis]